MSTSATPVRWQGERQWIDRLDGPAAPDWLHLADDPRARCVKSNPVRRVWEVQSDAGALFVKEYLGARLGGVPTEWRAAQEARRRAVPTVRCVAHGAAGGRRFLISIALPDARTLQDAWTLAGAASAPSTARREILLAAARLLATAHDAGFLHGDEHAGNILITTADPSTPAAVYADLAGSKTVARVSPRSAAQSLAQLNQWFRRRTPRRLRLRFLTAYCRFRAGGDAFLARSMIREISPLLFAATQQQAQSLFAKRDRRILGNNRYFAHLRLPDGSRAHVALRFRQRDLSPSPSAPNRTEEQWRELLADRPTADVMVKTESRASGLTGRWRQRCCRWTRRSRLKAWFVNSHRLRNRDIPCRWPIALVGGALWLDARPTTEPLMERLRGAAMSPADRRRILRSLADLVTLMSDRGASVSAVTADTFGVANECGGILIDDPAGVMIRRRDSDRDVRVTAMALLDAARATGTFRAIDAARFLKSLDPGRWRHLWAEIASTHKEPNQ